MALVALGVRSMGEWSWHTFGVGLGIGGAAALVLGMYSLIDSGKTFEALNRLHQSSTPPAGEETFENPQTLFLLVMIFAGSVAIGAGQYLQKLF